MRILVLAYHSHNISGPDYAANDHAALASDLETIQEAGAQVRPLIEIARIVRDGRVAEPGPMLVGLSFDDGPVFDARDFDHPRLGPQRGFLNILRDFRGRHGAAKQPGLHATSFVIASPEARAAMERAEDCGFPHLQDWLHESWWSEAVGSGLMGIGNHSWDHVHHAPRRIALSCDVRDDFTAVDNYVDADGQVRRAAAYINARIPGSCELFAYPFGHVNDYLSRDYLPSRAAEHGMVAAFGVGAERITPETSPWNIPRVVCGLHWRRPEELRALLER